MSNCFRVVVCLNSSLETFSWLVQRWVFYAWRSICCLNLILYWNMKHIQSNEPRIHDVLQDYIFRVEASKRLRWSTAVWCRWRNLKPVHVIRKILWKPQSVMIGKCVAFWRVKMQIWLIYRSLLVNECCGTLGTAVKEALFCTVFYGRPCHRNDTWMWKYWFLYFSWYSLLGAFILFYRIKKVSVSTIQSIKCKSDFLDFWNQNTSNWHFPENRGCMSKMSSKSLQ